MKSIPLSDADWQRRDALAQSMLISAHVANYKNVNSCLDAMQAEFGWAGVFYAAFRWMEIAAQENGLTAENYGPDAYALPLAVKDGKLIELREANVSLATEIAMQTFTAFLSRQFSTAAALLRSGVDKGFGNEVLSALLHFCARLVKEFLDRDFDDIIVTHEPG